VPPDPPAPPRGRLVVIGAGKASAAMARAVEDHWPGALGGLVVTRYGYGLACERIEIVEATHPVPDAAGLAAAQRMVEVVARLTADDVVLCLISGGGSALLSLPTCVLLSGGETTVTVRGTGRGGRNVEFLLSLGIALGGHPRIHALAGDTDGVDGQEEGAGTLLGPDSLARAWSLGIKPRESLANNDGHGCFEALGDAVVTGPTLTNVNDVRAILIAAA
jgi:glycerate-2-kinase